MVTGVRIPKTFDRKRRHLRIVVRKSSGFEVFDKVLFKSGLNHAFLKT